MAKTGNTGFKRILNAFIYSSQGIRAAYKHEAAFRQEVWLAIVLVPTALYFGDSYFDKAIMISSLVFVLIVELLNSALESVVDRIGDEHHELAGRAKDMGSASVLLSIITAIIIWITLLI